MSHKIDERKDNIRKIKDTIENTQNNIELAADMIETSRIGIGDKQALKNQNRRRKDSVDAFQDKLKEQIIGKEMKNK